MSVDTLVFLSATKLTNVAKWQEVIDQNGFQAVLDDFDPRAEDGYRPCTFKNEKCGFEFSFEPMDADFRESFDFDIPEKWDSVAVFSTRSSLLDLKMATIAAGSFAVTTAGGVYDENTDSIVESRGMLPWVTDALASYAIHQETDKEADEDQADRVSKAYAIIDQLGDDQTAVDRMFAQVLDSLNGITVESLSTYSAVSIHLSDGSHMELCDWEFILDNGESLAKLSYADNGIQLIGKGRPDYVYPWKIHVDLLSWICDKDGLYCDVY